MHAVHHSREVAHLFRDRVNGFNRMIDSGRGTARAKMLKGHLPSVIYHQV